jgi:hypothetical protein
MKICIRFIAFSTKVLDFAVDIIFVPSRRITLHSQACPNSKLTANFFCPSQILGNQFDGPD